MSDIIKRLAELTEEERIILGGGRINTSDYFSDKEAIIKSNGLFGGSYEIGIRRHTRFAEFPLHKHSYLEVMVVLGGSVTHIINSEGVRLEAGDILFMNKHVEHSVMKTGVSDIAVNISLSDGFLSGAFADLNGTAFFRILAENANPHGAPCYLHFSAAEDKAVNNLTENIIIELLSASKDTIAAKYVEVLLGYLARESDRLLSGGSTSTDKHSMRVREISEYISSNCTRATLGELGSRLYLCTPYLSKYIKEHFGKSFKELLVDEKMRRAEELIRKTDMNIGDIIGAVGYDNESYFHKEFKKRYARTPLCYRKAHKKSGF